MSRSRNKPIEAPSHSASFRATPLSVPLMRMKMKRAIGQIGILTSLSRPGGNGTCPRLNRGLPTFRRSLHFRFFSRRFRIGRASALQQRPNNLQKSGPARQVCSTSEAGRPAQPTRLHLRNCRQHDDDVPPGEGAGACVPKPAGTHNDRRSKVRKGGSLHRCRAAAQIQLKARLFEPGLFVGGV
jgi:hypothetical protein